MDFKTLVRIPVFTESGSKLGIVQNAELDLQNHSVRLYIVGTKFFGKNLYHVRPSQIKDITLEKIIVEDALVMAKRKEVFRSEQKPTSPSLGGVVPINNNKDN